MQPDNHLGIVAISRSANGGDRRHLDAANASGWSVSAPASNYSRAGVTLVELMVVILVIGILFSILMPAFGRLRHRARIADANSVNVALKDAIMQYKFEYGFWPLPDPPPADGNFANGNHEVITRLLLDHADNKKKILFLQIDDYERNATGSIVDPWGRPFIIKFDLVKNTVKVSYPNPP